MSGPEQFCASRHGRHERYVGHQHCLSAILSVLCVHCVSKPEPHATVAMSAT